MNTTKIFVTLALALSLLILTSCKKKDDNSNPTPENGTVAPDFTLESNDGTTISLSDLKGKVIIVDFWASWCGYCKAENPNVVRMYNQYHDQGLEVLGISIDQNKEDWKMAITEQQLPYLHVIDTQAWNAQTVMDYGVNSIPHLALIDRNGNLVATSDQIGLLEIEMLKLLANEN